MNVKPGPFGPGFFVPTGGGGGTRTPGLYSAIVALSQLSYAPLQERCEYMFCSLVGQTWNSLKTSRFSANAHNGANVRGKVPLANSISLTDFVWTSHRRRAILQPSAGVTQLVECLLPKQNVVGSSPITRSTLKSPAPMCRALAFERIRALTESRSEAHTADRAGVATHFSLAHSVNSPRRFGGARSLLVAARPLDRATDHRPRARSET